MKNRVLHDTSEMFAYFNFIKFKHGVAIWSLLYRSALVGTSACAQGYTLQLHDMKKVGK